jgi:hypothetical protein
MSAVTRPRGPLPARVYWTRRLIVIGVALALVFGLGRLLGGGSDGRSDGDTAALAGSDTQPRQGATHRPSSGSTARHPTTKPKPTKTLAPLAQPDGPCDASEVLVTPHITGAMAGGEVVLTLELTSTDSAACTWRVSAGTVALKLTSGSDFIWSSQQCPDSITAQDVILRKPVAGDARVQPVKIGVHWSGRRSDVDCSRTTDWARTGYYHATAAALGGTATDQQFQLDFPNRPTITVTVTPKNQPTDEPTTHTSSHPTGASEPSNPD